MGFCFFSQCRSNDDDEDTCAGIETSKNNNKKTKIKQKKK